MQLLGPYRLGARLGRGSSGQTFLAARPGEVPVALEIFDPPFAEDTVLASELASRARALAALRSPARVPVLDVGREPALHVASELVGGQSFAAVLRKARFENRALPQVEALALLRPVVEALIEGHRHRDETGRVLVHGTLSPRDVLVDYAGRVRLLGIGMGRLTRLPFSPTRQGYVAPEVVRGRPASPLSDAFSVAALVYEVVAGRGPFRSPRPEDAEKAVLHGSFSPLKPNQVDSAPGLDDWVNETLLPKPELRPGGLERLLPMLSAEVPDLGPLMAGLFAPEAEGFQRMCAAVSGANGSRDGEVPIDAERPSVGSSSTHDLPELVERDADVREELGELRQVARYVLDARLWSEGAIDEFNGTDPNLDRAIRLRLLTPRADDAVDEETQVRLFKREARYLARVDHPCLPRLLDAGRAAERYFTVISRRPGHPLAEHLGAGWDLDGRRLLVDLVGAMEAAHEVGLLLGVLPVDAVALTPSGRADVVRLPTLHSARKGPHPLLEGRTSGVPPEWREQGRWDGASDQWVVGALVTRALVGKALGPSLAALHEDLLEEEPELLATLRRMTAADPNARFSSAGAIRVESGPSEGSSELSGPFAELCQRAAGLSLRIEDSEAFFDDPARVAAALARRRGLPPERFEALRLATAVRGLARRTRLPPLGEELAGVVPPQAGPLLELVSATPSGEPVPAAEGRTGGRSLDAEILRLAEAFVEARRHGTDPLDKQVLALRAHFSSVLVDDLVLEIERRLRDSESAPGPRGRVLLAGFGIRDLAQQLGQAGLEVVLTQDGHEAWELLRGQGHFRGAILSQPLPGRDGQSLIKLCRSHPGLAQLPVWLAAEVFDAETRLVAEENGAIVVDGPERLEILPALVRRRLAS